MGNVISVGVGDPDCQVNRLKRGSFFANGATVEHGNHLHQFEICDDQVVVRNLKKADENSETTMVTEEETLSRKKAYSKYISLMSPADGVGCEVDSLDCEEDDIYRLFRISPL
ncbi:hypothetical protein [Legionella shakespearei]|uniref:Uncharacterized protein n=1 Tax=Legionella shakespearei DSM 23087 TaxID=1122169 RepID=A0A0W0YH71_9GAMM|nr:hypothetical protein [Legionella shakespearei]KTD56224.1 hypothetical protein Lsha_2912 [Legionella shakespearei DSM 23087]